MPSLFDQFGQEFFDDLVLITMGAFDALLY